MTDYDRMAPLVSRYFDGLSTREELAELEERLLTDDEFAQHVSRWCLMHGHVAELLTESALHQLMDQFKSSSPGARAEILNAAAAAAAKPLKVRFLPSAGFFRSRTLWIGALAATVAFAALAHVLWRSTQEAPQVAAAAKTPSRLATLTQLTNAVWVPGAAPYHHGEQLVQGNRIALQSGMAKITFDCGAEIVLEGPCDFQVRDAMVGYLKSGKITADVPRRAFAFAILSPAVDFVDLGTSFGLNIGAEGHAELHVFRGEVLCSRPSPAEKARNAVYHVTANNAVEFRPAADGPSDIAMNEQQFADHFTLRRGMKLAAEPPPGNHLALWLAADSGVTTDAQKRVIAWQDILYGDNQSGEDAIQVEEAARPLLVPAALAGMPAVRFDGNSDYLLTTPLATTDDQTVALVCQFSPSAADKSRRWGGQLLNYDGPPSRYLSDTLEPGVLQIGEPLLESEFRPTLFSAQVFAGFIGSATVESGRVDAVPVGINTPVVLTYRYDLTHSRAALAINGKQFGESRAFAPQAITSRKIIGRHAWMQNYFHGDLAELMIYNEALSPREMAETTAYLAKKYSIVLTAANDAHEVRP